MAKLTDKQEADLFYRVFSTEDGQKALQILNEKYIYSNSVPPKAVNIEFNAGIVEGERGLMKWILSKMAQSQNSND